MSVVLDKAKDLAEAIVDSEELNNVRAAEAAMGNDKEALEIIRDFQEHQKIVFEKRKKGEQLTEVEEAKVKEIESRMEGNVNIKSYLEAQMKFENLLQGVNFIISQALSGGAQEGGCSCGSSDCGPGCEGCN